VVALPPQASASARRELLGNEIEQFVVEAKKLGMGLDDVLNAVSEHWKRLGSAIEDAATQTVRGGRKG
jgi:DNA-binding transcriptional regulator YhcF (GntR family)